MVVENCDCIVIVLLEVPPATADVVIMAFIVIIALPLLFILEGTTVKDVDGIAAAVEEEESDDDDMTVPAAEAMAVLLPLLLLAPSSSTTIDGNDDTSPLINEEDDDVAILNRGLIA